MSTILIKNFLLKFWSLKNDDLSVQYNIIHSKTEENNLYLQIAKWFKRCQCYLIIAQGKLK